MDLESLLLDIENDDKIILDLCSGTGSWSKPYVDSGYNVIHVTLPEMDARLWPSYPRSVARMPTEYHDVREYIGEVHGILAGPPCTMFANSGAQHARTDAQMLEALSVADACIRLAYVLKPVWWVLENPRGKINKWLGDPIFKFDPCDFGDPYTKETWLWGRFKIPERNYVVPVDGSKVHNMSSGNKEGRSITPSGFAKAFFEANP